MGIIKVTPGMIKVMVGIGHKEEVERRIDLVEATIDEKLDWLLTAIEKKKESLYDLLIDKIGKLEILDDVLYKLLLKSISKCPEIIPKLIENIKEIGIPKEEIPDLLHLAAKFNCLALMDLALENKIEVNVERSNSVTPLMLAIEYGAIEAADFLLSKGADVGLGIKKLKGEDALIFACNIVEDSEKLIKLCDLFKKHGMDFNQSNVFGETALLSAFRRADKELAEALVKHGASSEYTKEARGEYLQKNIFQASHIASMETSRLNPSSLAPKEIQDLKLLLYKAVELQGFRLTQDVVLSGNWSWLNQLLEHKIVFIGQKIVGSDTLYDLAIKYEKKEILEGLLKYEAQSSDKVKEVLKAQDLEYIDPINKALILGHKEAAKFLIKNAEKCKDTAEVRKYFNELKESDKPLAAELINSLNDEYPDTEFFSLESLSLAEGAVLPPANNLDISLQLELSGENVE